MKPLSKTNAIIDKIHNAMLFLACILLAFSWLSVCADVILRYFLHRPLAWATEVTEYILLYITFLGSAWLLKEGGHVTVDVLINKLNSINRTVVFLISSAIASLVCLIFTIYGIIGVIETIQQGTVLDKTLIIPKYLVLIVIPVGFFTLFAQFVSNSIISIIKLKSDRS